METHLLKLLSHNKIIPPLKSKKGIFVVDDTIGVSLLMATYFNETNENILILASNLYNAQKIANLLCSLINEKDVLLFPSDELFRATNLAESKELLAQRLYTLSTILYSKHKIVIVHPSSFLRYLPSDDLFKTLTFKLKIGDKIDVKNFVDSLLNSGYYRTNKVSSSLEFAKRGDIIDIYSINYDKPIRISLFDNEIESLNLFDVASQESIEKLDEVVIMPASDMIFNQEEKNNIATKIKKQAKLDKTIIDESVYERLLINLENDIEDLTHFAYKESLYKYYGFLQDTTHSLFDYFNPNLVFFSNYSQFLTSSELLIRESLDYLEELVRNGKTITHLSMFQNLEHILANKKGVVKTKHYLTNTTDNVFNVRPIISIDTNIESILNTIKSYLHNKNKIIITLANVSQKETIKNILKDAHLEYEEINGLSIPKKDIGIAIYSLFCGFELVDEKLVILSSRELFHYKVSSSRFLTRFKEGKILHSYEELKPGDYVVHEYNGIGQFIDVVTMKVDDVNRDFLYIEYANKAKLYVPLNQFRLVRKYVGREGVKPKLTNLNGVSWNNTKKKIRERLDELTSRLDSLYKERAKLSGFSFNKDDEYQEQFNNEFVHSLTEDQQKAYEEICSDMEKPYPMDRLLCGDVGFGKTEIAFRSIFKCINSHKQAAMLCPTTLLCRQHYELAKIRFASFGIKIAVFSRLIPKKEQNQYIKEIKEGKIHLVIGTHRLLSKDIEFNDLGLLVVDEEQRFGVEQKERIKEIKKDVDVLSLSATPIPRTLQMSLVGMRELSQINTAPLNRNPIQTYVTPYNSSIIKELIERELSRDGQVFYVHNNTNSIFQTARNLKSLVPLANVGVVHGKMDKERIEDVMMNFYNGNINLLVATSIIENGIDVPNANMIIVENADTFGLAQLYQIKGRVGRSDRIAYAYLLYNEHKIMNEEASKRLKAIQEFAELGSGYKIAQRDLMIRGAGDILGKEQAGFIDSVGIDLYLKLLNESIQKNRKIEVFNNKPVRLFSLNAYIPNSYINKGEKIEIYQEIENANNDKELKKIEKKIKDIYGPIPNETKTLFLKRKIDIILSNLEFSFIDETNDKIVIKLSEAFCSKNGIALKLFDVLYECMDKIKVSYMKKELRIDIIKKANWLELLFDVVKKIHQLYIEEK